MTSQIKEINIKNRTYYFLKRTNKGFQLKFAEIRPKNIQKH